MSKFERTSPGNPHRLTVKQHLVSAAHIDRFSEDGRVAVYLPGSQNSFLARARNDAFCVMRQWSHKAESVFFQKIEAAFQRHVSELLRDLPVAHDVVNAYASLWSIRLKHAEPAEPVQLEGVSPERLTQEQEELLEARGVAFVRESGMPARLASYPTMIRDHDMNMQLLAEHRWGVWRAPLGQRFICADSTIALSIIPVNPSLCLALGADDKDLTADEMRAQVTDIANSGTRFVFGHPLDQASLSQGPAQA